MASAKANQSGALDACFQADGGNQRQVRRRGDPSVEAQVRACLRDHFKGFAAEQIDGVRISGPSMGSMSPL